MPAGCHIALVGFRFNDVDNAVEEIGLAMLAAEVLQFTSTQFSNNLPWNTDPAENVVMIGEVSLASCTTVDASRVEIDVVG
jgi:hypothetical protein